MAERGQHDPVQDLNKQTLADQVAARAKLDPADAYKAVEAVFDVIANRVAQGARVSITNFGSFHAVERAARTARNPLTGEAVEVPPRRTAKLAPSPRWLKYMNSPAPEEATIRKMPKAPRPPVDVEVAEKVAEEAGVPVVAQANSC